MNKGFIFFIGGAAIGYVIGMLYSKKKYQKIADEEIASVVEEFRKKKKGEHKSEAVENLQSAVNDAKSAIDDLKNAMGTKKAKTDYDGDIGKSMSKTANITLIDEQDFDTYEDEHGIPYETERLYYYTDGVVATDGNDILDDVDQTIGEKSLEYFSDWDSVYVRNHDLGLDYEILKSLITFKEAVERENDK